MREFVIQKAWDQYQKDFGLGRILIFVSSYNIFLFFLSLVFFQTFDILFLVPVFFAIFYFGIRQFFVRWKPRYQFMFLFIPTLLSIGFNYFLIGRLNRIAGGLDKLDEYFLKFEFFLFGDLLGHWIEKFVHNLGSLGMLQFDLMMISYVTFYLLPYLGAIRFFTKLKHDKKFIIGRFFGSLIIFHSLNYVLYLLIPVTGPQHFIPHHYLTKINFTYIGEFLHSTIHHAQNNYIDCFPSGHLGASLLVAFWMFRIKDQWRWGIAFLVIMIGLATLTLRYHYVLDLCGAIPLALLAYFLGKQLIPMQHQQADYQKT